MSLHSSAEATEKCFAQNKYPFKDQGWFLATSASDYWNIILGEMKNRIKNSVLIGFKAFTEPFHHIHHTYSLPLLPSANSIIFFTMSYAYEHPLTFSFFFLLLSCFSFSLFLFLLVLPFSSVLHRFMPNTQPLSAAVRLHSIPFPHFFLWILYYHYILSVVWHIKLLCALLVLSLAPMPHMWWSKDEKGYKYSGKAMAWCKYVLFSDKMEWLSCLQYQEKMIAIHLQ